MSIGTAIFLIFLIIAAAVAAWYFLVRRPGTKTTTPRDTYIPAPAAPRESYAPAPSVARPAAPAPVFYDPAPRVVVDQRPVYVGTYNNPMNDLTNLIIAEEIIDEIREERREERFEEMREERFEESRQERYEEPARYEAPQEQYSEPERYEAPDTGGSWDDSGDFGSGDSGSF